MFVFRSPLHKPDNDSSKSTMISRAWGRSAAWLKRRVNHPNKHTAACARFNFFHYHHPFPRTPDPQQAEDLQLFLSWKDLVTYDMWNSDGWIKAFYRVAVWHAHNTEQSAFRAASSQKTALRTASSLGSALSAANSLRSARGAPGSPNDW